MPLQTLLDADYKEMGEVFESQMFWMNHPRLLTLYNFWLTIEHHIVFNLLCRRGATCHIEMEGHAGPDSGYEDWWCTRCGRSGGHIYY